MSNPFDQFDAPAQEEEQPGNPFDQYDGGDEPVAEPMQYGIMPALRRAADPPIMLAKGIYNAAMGAKGLFDLATGGVGQQILNVADQAANGKPAGEGRFDSSTISKGFDSMMSPEQQAANKRVEGAEGFWETTGAMIKDPTTILQAGIESAPSMVAGMGIARGAMGIAPKLPAVVAGAIGEGTIGAGQAVDQIESQNKGDLTLGQSAAAVASGVGTGLFSLIGGRIAQRLGLADVDTMLAQGYINKSHQGITKRLIGGGISEGLLEEMPQSAQEQLWINAATGKPLTEGLPEAMAQGLLVGALMGSGSNVLAKKSDTDDTDLLNPDEKGREARQKEKFFGDIFNRLESGEWTLAEVQAIHDNLDQGDPRKQDLADIFFEYFPQREAPVSTVARGEGAEDMQRLINAEENPSGRTAPISTAPRGGADANDLLAYQGAQDYFQNKPATGIRPPQPLTPVSKSAAESAGIFLGQQNPADASYQVFDDAGLTPDRDERARIANQGIINGISLEDEVATRPASSPAATMPADRGADPASPPTRPTAAGILSEPMTLGKLNKEVVDFQGKGGIATEAKAKGFKTAFRDSETGKVYDSLDETGKPSVVHNLDGLPDEVVLKRDEDGYVLEAKPSIESGFTRDGKFFTRQEAADDAEKVSIDTKANEAATSPLNDMPEPTEAQKEAGNYKKGKIKVHGLDVSIENPEGSTRSGVNEDGKAWENTIKSAHYGYFKGSEAKDGDQVDVFVAPGKSDKVYVIDQVNPKTGKFDEPKVVTGAKSEAEAREIYLSNYEEGWQGLGAITEMPVLKFKQWIKGGKKTRPVGKLPQPGEGIPKEPWEQSQQEYIESRFETEAEKGIGRQAPIDYVRKHRDSVRKRLESEWYDVTEKAFIEGRQVAPNAVPVWAISAEQMAARSDDTLDGYLRQSHREAVKAAMSDGKPVPQSILDSYPDLSPTVKQNLTVEATDTEFPLARVRSAYAHTSMNPGIAAEVEKGDFDRIVGALQDELEQNTPEENRGMIGSAIDQFKRDYIKNSGRRWGSRSSTVSAMIAGPSKFNSKQAGRRSESLDNAEDAFAKWLKTERENVRNKLGVNQVYEQRRIEKEDKQKAAGEVAKVELVKMWDALKVGDKVDLGGNDPVTIAKKNKFSFLTDAKNPDSKYTLKEVYGIDHAEAQAILDGAQKPAPQEADLPSAETVTEPSEMAAPVPISEETLKDLALLMQFGDRWKYKFAIGSSWMTANTKEDAVERATEAYHKAKPEERLTRAQRDQKADEEETAQMDQNYGRLSLDELRTRYQEMGGIIKDLQRAGQGEFTGTGDRRTSKAVSNEGARNTGEERMRLNRYIAYRESQEQGKAKEEAPASPYTIDAHKEMMGKLDEGTITPEEFKAAFESMVKNKEAIAAELQKYTKERLLKLLGAMGRYRYKNDNKPMVVKAAVSSMLEDFVLGGSYGFDPFGGGQEAAIRKLVDGYTEKDFEAYRERRKAALEDYKKRVSGYVKSIKNPETLEEFETFIEANGKDKLTAEQQEKYDTLKADDLKAKAQKLAERKATLGAVGEIPMEIVAGKHTKKGHDIWTVKLWERVERDAYNDLNTKAKRLGGYYSSYRGNGAIPGFVFDSEDSAKKFMALREGDVSIADEVNERKDKKRSESAQRLMDMAEKLEAKGNEKLNQDRNTNTARRARMAAGAEAEAQANIAFAKTLRSIATAIEAGEIKYLDKLTQKVQLSELEDALRSAKYKAIQNENKAGHYFEDQKHRPPSREDVQYAKLPELSIHGDHLRTFAETLKRAKGAGTLARQIEAMGRAINFEQDRKVTLNRQQEEVVRDALKRAAEHNKIYTHWDKKVDTPWYIESKIAETDRLKRMGIETDEQLRAALRELVDIRSHKTLEDPIKKAERALIGNKNVGVDFFPTPKPVINQMLQEAEIEPGMSVLEPSAGKGDIAEAVREETGIRPDVAEISSTLRDVLKAKGYEVENFDFMDMGGQYDRIVMNPPFSGNKDIKHVRHAYDLLKPGGRIVAIMSEHGFFAQEKEARDFREWLDEVGRSEELPAGSFQGKEAFRQTGVNSRLVVIDKPGTAEPITQLKQTAQEKPQEEPEQAEPEPQKEAADGPSTERYRVESGNKQQLVDRIDEAMRSLPAPVPIGKNVSFGKPAKVQGKTEVRVSFESQGDGPDAMLIKAGRYEYDVIAKRYIPDDKYGKMTSETIGSNLSMKDAKAFAREYLDGMMTPHGQAEFITPTGATYKITRSHYALERFKNQVLKASPAPKFSTLPEGGSSITTRQVQKAFDQKGFTTERIGNLIRVKTASGNLYVDVTDMVVENDEAAIKIGYGRSAQPGEKVAGSYQNFEGTGTIRLKRNLADEYTLAHETYHHLRAAGVLTSMELAVVRKAAGPDEEAQARWIEGKLRERGSEKGIVSRLIQKIADWLDAFANLFTVTERGLLRGMESGKFLKRESYLGDVAPMVEGDYSTRNQTESEAFKKWFGRSVVRQPVYHWTDNDFTEFDMDAADGLVHVGTKQAAWDRARGMQNIGYEIEEDDDGFLVFADSGPMQGEGQGPFKTEKEAAAFVKKQPKRIEPLALYAKIENPLRVPDLGMWPFDAVRSHLSRENIITDKEADKAWEAWSKKGDREGWKVLKDIIRKHGYDGFVYTNEQEDAGSDSYIVFEPEQLKSATNNSGDFSPDSPNLFLSTKTPKEQGGHKANLRREETETLKAVTDWLAQTGRAIKTTAKANTPGNMPDLTMTEQILKSPEWYEHPIVKKIVRFGIDRHDLFYQNFNEINEVADPKSPHDTVTDATKELKHKGLSKLQRIAGKSSKEYKELQEMVDYGDTDGRQFTGDTIEERLEKFEQHFRDKGFSEDAISVWKLHRAAYDTALDKLLAPMRELDEKAIEKAAYGMSGDAFDKFMSMRNDKGEKQWLSLKEVISEMETWRGFYAPRIRDAGQWVVKASKGGSPLSNQREHVRYHHTTRFAAERHAEKLRGKGYVVAPVEENAALGEDVLQHVKTMATAELLDKAAENIAGGAGMNAEAALRFHDELVNQVADLIRARGFRSTMIHRKEGNVVRGYIEDPAERYVRYASNTAAGLAKARTASLMTETLFGKFEDGERVGGIQPDKEPRAYGVAQKYIMEQLRNADATDRYVGIAKGITTIKYLGFNPKAAFINMTSMVTTVPAALRQYATDGNASIPRCISEMAKAGKDYAAFMKDGKRGKLSMEEYNFLLEAKRNGYDDPQYTRDSIGIIRGLHGKVFAKTMEGAMKIFGATEKWNRGATMLAAYRMAEGGETVRKEKARTVIEKAHGVYGRATLPSWAQGSNPAAKVGQLVYVYQKFGHNWLQMLYDLGAKKKDMQSFVWALASPVVIGGAAAIPMKTAAVAIMQALLSGLLDDRDLENVVWDGVREHLGGTAETAMRYGVAGLAGVDISGSLSFDPMVSSDLTDYTGAIGEAVRDVAGATKHAFRGEGYKAIEKLAPTVVANPMRAYREAKEGATTQRGNRIFDEQNRPYMPSGLETGMKVAGFRSSRRATVQARSYENRRQLGNFRDRRQSINEEYKAYLASRDPEAKQEVLEKIRQFNNDIKKNRLGGTISPITGTSLRQVSRNMARPRKNERLDD